MEHERVVQLIKKKLILEELKPITFEFVKETKSQYGFKVFHYTYVYNNRTYKVEAEVLGNEILNQVMSCPEELMIKYYGKSKLDLPTREA